MDPMLLPLLCPAFTWRWLGLAGKALLQLAQVVADGFQLFLSAVVVRVDQLGRQDGGRFVLNVTIRLFAVCGNYKACASCMQNVTSTWVSTGGAPWKNLRGPPRLDAFAPTSATSPTIQATCIAIADVRWTEVIRCHPAWLLRKSLYSFSGYRCNLSNFI